MPYKTNEEVGAEFNDKFKDIIAAAIKGERRRLIEQLKAEIGKEAYEKGLKEGAEGARRAVKIYRENHRKYPMKTYENGKNVILKDYNKGYRQALEDVWKGIATTPLQDNL